MWEPRRPTSLENSSVEGPDVAWTQWGADILQLGCNFKTLKPGNLLGKHFFCSFSPPTAPGWGTFYQHYTRTCPRNSRPSSLPSFLCLVSRMGHKMSGLGASPFQPSPPPTSLSISLPQPLGFEAFRSFSMSVQAFLSFLWVQIGTLEGPKGPS